MKKVKVKFTEKNLTGNAGLVHFGRFIDKLNLPGILAGHLSITRGAGADYQACDAVLMLLFGVIAGAKHVSHLVILKTDRVLRKIFDWDKFPVDTTFGRLFRLFSFRNCNELLEVEDKVRRKVWKKKWFGRVTMDFDSSVIGVYGSQEGAEKGYNPFKKGQKSYHPVFCFIAETRECLSNRFRPGKTYSANGIVEFGKECFARLPKGVWKVFVRADSAFFNGSFFDFPESKGASYLIKVKMKGLTNLLSGKKWKKIRNADGFESTEFEYQCSGWSKPRRFVAVRELIGIKTEGLLFPEYEYNYFCYVTNEDYSHRKAHKKYGKRSTSENWIEWCKNQMAVGSIRTQDFWANSAIFHTCVLAYNLMVWMMVLTNKNKLLHQEPNTIRAWLINVPARLLTSSRRLVLKLSQNSFFKGKWLEIEKVIDCLRFE